MSTNAGFIQGVVVFYKGQELSDMSSRAAAYHDERAKSLRKIADDFRKLKQGEKESLSTEAQIYSTKSGNHGDPGVNCENDAASHERKKRLHEHLAAHYDKEARYGLTMNDLSVYGLTNH